MTGTIDRSGQLQPERFLGFAIAYGEVGDGREVVVQRRMYNTIMTIGPVGASWFSDSW
jgi:hypothetical protein